MHFANENIGKKLPYHSQIDFLFPAKPTKLETVGHFAIEAAMGNLDAASHQLISHDLMVAHESAQ